MTDDVAAGPIGGNSTVFVSGPPGSGKTTLAVRRLLFLLRTGVPAEQILILVPQRTLAEPFLAAINSPEAPPGGQADVATIGGLARRTLELFWPLVASQAGFANPRRSPRFLTLETAQYFLDRVAEPFIARGAFDGIAVARPRLVSQILDDLNKAAAVGFPVDEIGERLKAAWQGESSRHRVYDEVQAVALEFRRTCLRESLLDWSLQMQVFSQQLLPLPQLRRYLLSGYRHVIADNVEEDVPAAHDLLRLWLPLCESAHVNYDTEGGHRIFLGADPAGALALSELCRTHVALTQTYVGSPHVQALGAGLLASLLPAEAPQPLAPRGDARLALRFPEVELRFYPQMIDWTAEQVSRLVMEEGTAPGDIAILAPFVSDALRFQVAERLGRFGIPMRTHRPSRELREEPAVRCLLTLAKLGHPDWPSPPAAVDVAHALELAVEGFDPVRARLLTNIVYRVREGRPTLSPFHQIGAAMQERISYALGLRFSELCEWLERYAAASADRDGSEELDHFWSRLFGELLSQPGFGFHSSPDGARFAANLIESVRKFRRVTGLHEPDRARAIGQAYVELVEQGVVAAQYVSSWTLAPRDAVLLVPAYTFLMMNRPVSVQFWLDAGSLAWHERIYQPLTHPYVLTRDWARDRTWTEGDELRVRQEALARLVLGLLRRCRDRVFLAYSMLNEQGFEQQGPLLQSVEHVLRRWRRGDK